MLAPVGRESNLRTESILLRREGMFGLLCSGAQTFQALPPPEAPDDPGLGGERRFDPASQRQYRSFARRSPVERAGTGQVFLVHKVLN